MPSIALMSVHNNPWLRQAPQGKAEYDGYRFTINQVDPDCELVVAYNELARNFPCSLPPERRVLMTSEPPGMSGYSPQFANQFGEILGPVSVADYQGRWRPGQPALNWFYGIVFNEGYVMGQRVVMDYEALAALPPGKKIKGISAVISTKTTLEKHRLRLEFTKRLKAELGDALHLFGRGFQQIGDKAEAMAPYRYTLVIENNDIPHFWTEKLADAYLGWTLPIFSGCANVGDYFPQESFVAIDIEKPDEAIKQIRALLEQDPWESRLPALAEARRRLMEEYNILKVLTNLAREKQALPLVGGRVTIRPTMGFAPLPQRLRWLWRSNFAKPFRNHTRGMRRAFSGWVKSFFDKKTG